MKFHKGLRFPSARYLGVSLQPLWVGLNQVYAVRKRWGRNPALFWGTIERAQLHWNGALQQNALMDSALPRREIHID